MRGAARVEVGAGRALVYGGRMAHVLTRLALAAALAAGTAGCGLLDPPVPEHARVVLTGPDGANVRLVTSSKFLAGITTEGITRVEVLAADTFVVALPHDSRQRIRADQRFLALAEAIEGETAEFRMQVFIDESREYDAMGTLSDASLFRFVYTFNLRVTDQVQVVF
jgi:hypothetical protein